MQARMCYFCLEVSGKHVGSTGSQVLGSGIVSIYLLAINHCILLIV